MIGFYLGRYPGEIRHFVLYNEQGEGKHFEVLAEWLSLRWLAQCPWCKDFGLRKLHVMPEQKIWYCEKCEKKGPFKKPQKKIEKVL